MKILLSLGVFICFFLRSLSVEALVETSTETSIEKRGKFSFFINSMPSLEKEGEKKDVGNRESGYIFDLDFKYKIKEVWQFQINPFLQETKTKVEDNKILEPNEANLQYKKNSRQILLGYHRTNWEGTDLVNPMDLVHPKNYLNPLSAQTRPSAGLYYSDQVKKFGWNFIYIPKQEKAILPLKTSPWWPRDLNLPLISEGTTVLLPDQMRYEILEDEVVNKALDHNVALRLQQHFDSVDISLAAFEGSSQTPILDFSVTDADVIGSDVIKLRSPILVQPTYYRNRVAAMALSYISKYGIYRLSAQHNQPLGESSVNPGWSDLGVLEFETSDIFKTFPDLTLVMEIIYSKRESFGGLAVLSNLLEKAYLLGLRWPLTENLIFQSAIYQEQKNKGTFFHNELKWIHSDHWSSEFTADTFQGIAESAMGAYSKNNQIAYKLNLVF